MIPRRKLLRVLAAIVTIVVVVVLFNSETARPEPNNSKHTYEQAWVIFRDSLNRYKGLHKRGIKALRSSEPNNVKTLTWACSRTTCNSGIGDQLLKIQFFFLLAVMSDRIFTVTWEEDLRQRTGNLRHHQINWDVFNSSLGMCSHISDPLCSRNRNVYASTSFYGFGWTEREYEQFGEALFGEQKHITVLANVFVSVMFIGDRSMMRTGKLIEEGFLRLGLSSILDKDRYNGVYFTHNSSWYAKLHAVGQTNLLGILPMNEGYVVASESWVRVSHVILNYLFKFPTWFTIIKESLGIDSQPYVAVHLRTGFYGSPNVDTFEIRDQFKNWKLFDQSVWSCILNYSIEVSDSLIDPNSPIYVATDSLLAKEWAKRTYGARIRTAALNPAHFAHALEKQDDLSLWIDFLILAGAKILVRGDSSYATNAAFLAPIPISRQAWIWQDDKMKCMVSHLGSTTRCIC